MPSTESNARPVPSSWGRRRIARRPLGPRAPQLLHVRSAPAVVGHPVVFCRILLSRCAQAGFSPPVARHTHLLWLLRRRHRLLTARYWWLHARSVLVSRSL